MSRRHVLPAFSDTAGDSSFKEFLIQPDIFCEEGKWQIKNLIY